MVKQCGQSVKIYIIFAIFVSHFKSTNPIDLLLSSSGNIMWGITVLIQLAKGSSIIRHEMSPFTGARAFLLAALNNLASINPIVPPPSSSSVNHVTTTSGHVVGKQSRPCDAFQWIRAGIRHELLLVDLLVSLLKFIYLPVLLFRSFTSFKALDLS